MPEIRKHNLQEKFKKGLLSCLWASVFRAPTPGRTDRQNLLREWLDTGQRMVTMRNRSRMPPNLNFVEIRTFEHRDVLLKVFKKIFYVHGFGNIYTFDNIYIFDDLRYLLLLWNVKICSERIIYLLFARAPARLSKQAPIGFLFNAILNRFFKNLIYKSFLNSTRQYGLRIRSLLNFMHFKLANPWNPSLIYEKCFKYLLFKNNWNCCISSISNKTI